MKIYFYFIILFPFSLFGQLTKLYETNTKAVCEGMMQDGLKTGVWKFWDKNGKLYNSGSYAVVTKNNIQIRFFTVCPDTIGIIKEIRQKMLEKYSIETGKWESYYSDGKISGSGNYLPIGVIDVGCLDDASGSGAILHQAGSPTGMKIGAWAEYNTEGNIVFKTIYDNFGNLQEEIDYESGKIINDKKYFGVNKLSEETEYDKTGKIIHYTKYDKFGKVLEERSSPK